MLGIKIGKTLAMAVVLAMVLVSYLPMVPAEGTRADIDFLMAEVDIDNSYAITEITAKLVNPTSNPLDETFVFSIPEDAFITNFSLTVKGVTYYADIMKKDEAEQKFEDAKKAGNNAGIMTSRGKSTFAYGVSIAANDSVTVTLRYEDYIERTVDGYRFDLGLDSYEARTIGKFDVLVSMRYDRPILDLTAETYSETVIDMFGANETARVSYHYNDFKATEDFILTWDLEQTSVNGYMLFHEEGGEGYFFHVFNPAMDDLGGYIPKDIVFVLDVSGSMGGRKIEQLRDAFGEIVMDLRDGDRFEIISFSSGVDPEYHDLVDATYVQRTEAKDTINGISAGGGTNINDALLEGLDVLNTPRERVPIIVFLTDGQPTSGETNRNTIRENVRTHNELDVSIYCLGFGNNVEFDFLSALAMENNGFAQRIYEDSDASDQITDFYDTVSLPLLRNADFEYSEGTDEVYPTHVDNLYEGSEIVICGKYMPGTSSISFDSTAMTAAGETRFHSTFKVDTSGDHDFIRRYWAYAKIRYLMEEMTLAENDTTLVDDITNLSLEYGFVTDYTSLFVEVPDDDTFKPDPDQRPSLSLAGSENGGGSYDMKTGATPPAQPTGRTQDSGSLESAPGFEMALVLPAIAIIAVLMARRSRRLRETE
jgi:uncharacterized protein YegL